MITAHKRIAALVGLALAACATPSLAQIRTEHPAASTSPFGRSEHAGVTRALVVEECNRFAASEYPWFEDVNRADAYRACMAEHGQAE